MEYSSTRQAFAMSAHCGAHGNVGKFHGRPSLLNTPIGALDQRTPAHGLVQVVSTYQALLTLSNKIVAEVYNAQNGE